MTIIAVDEVSCRIVVDNVIVCLLLLCAICSDCVDEDDCCLWRELNVFCYVSNCRRSRIKNSYGHIMEDQMVVVLMLVHHMGMID